MAAYSLVCSAEEEVLPDLQKIDPEEVKADEDSLLEHWLAAQWSHIHSCHQNAYTKVMG